MGSRYKISFECSATAKEEMVKLLDYFEMMGLFGMTRDFTIEDQMFVFDGDGTDIIANIEVECVSADEDDEEEDFEFDEE